MKRWFKIYEGEDWFILGNKFFWVIIFIICEGCGIIYICCKLSCWNRLYICYNFKIFVGLLLIFLIRNFFIFEENKDVGVGWFRRFCCIVWRGR